MRFAVLAPVLGALVAAPGCLDTSDEVQSETFASEHDHGDHNCPGPSPIMQVGDFDGSGVVDNADKAMLEAYKDAGDYVAYFDMNADGKLTGRDVSIVARNKGVAATPRDLQMAALWATTSPYRNIGNALAAGYEPFTPDLHGHGIHFANFPLIYSWGDRGGFDPAAPEGLNYTADGRLVAAFYYAPGAIDLAEYGAPLPGDMFYQALDVPPSFDGLDPHEWHQHIGPCFGGATSPVPGFDQCMMEQECYDVGGQLWSPQFHMLHVWMYEFNECGPFGGIDHDISVGAPMEPNHGECSFPDVVHCVVTGHHADGTPMCADGSHGGHGGH